ncbi:hypothetical protein CKO51_13060 [Rhodopirellula sp. SM50]|nr:serine/threonine-protein kinase [Rhodopirellula sp. SM50]PAY19057.1 hypothetical protein CKO51_13060 [Rhodopirellula sp. SM50]
MNLPDEMFQLDEACSRFESAWSENLEPPNLRTFLDSVEDRNRASLFRLLLPIDIEHRCRRSMDVDAEFYRKQFSEFDLIIDSEFGSSDREPPDTITVNQDSSIDVEHDFSADMPDTVDFAEQRKSVQQQKPVGAAPTGRKQIGRYTILSELGGGGQADVFRAAHPTLPIEVAIKVGNKKLDETSRQAMVDEAQVLCELDHPGIAKIRDLDFDEEGFPILVLELVRGRSMATILGEGKVSEDRIIKWLSAAADALDYAHRRGVLHLDLKPGNIVITENDEAKVIDFGLARSRDVWSDVSNEEDRISGTPEYMPPEQAWGNSEKITSRADVFALGAILYRVLTGVSPFAAKSPQLALVRSRKYDLDPGFLDESTASPSLVDVCRQAIAEDPQDRFESAADFAKVLQATQTETDEGSHVGFPSWQLNGKTLHQEQSEPAGDSIP